MKIAVLGINFSPELIGISVYTTEMCQYLSSKDHRVTVFTGFPYYPSWEKPTKYRYRLYRNEKLGEIDIRRSYLFVPKSVRTFTRILHELSFMISSLINLLLAPKPDILIAISPPLGLGLVAYAISRIKRVPFVFHVQDLQPDAAVQLNMLHPGFILNTLYTFEHFIYSKATRVSAISNNMGEKIKRKLDSKQGVEHKVFTFRNWVNVNTFQPQIKNNGFRTKNELLNKFIILYSGNIGYKQGLDVILKAAEKTMNNDDFTFLIAGDGAYKKEFINHYNQSQQSNIRFFPLQPKEKFASFLAACDVYIIPQRKTAIDIVLPSKLLAIMSSARPVIVSARQGSELHRIVTEANCGIVVEPENTEQTVEALIRAYENPETMDQMGINGRNYAIEHFSKDKILTNLEQELSSIFNYQSTYRAQIPA